MPHTKSADGWLSVTEVLNLSIPKPFLNYWFGKWGTAKCEQIKRESQELGTRFHSLVEDYLNGISLSEGANAERMVENLINQFLKPYEVKPLKLEQQYKCEKLKLQGSCDAEIDTNKWKNVTADWKTSNSLDKISVPLQLSMYDYPRKGDGLGVAVRIDKESDKVDVHWYENLKAYNPVWRACIKVARFNKWGLNDK